MEPTFRLISKRVVFDTDGNWIYIGTLVDVDNQYYYLSDADAFDTSQVNITKHEYLIRVKKDGLVVNRKNIIIPKNKVFAITMLEDVVEG